MHWAVILAGGSGTRFWPLSSPSHPKQLLPLAGSRSSAADTLARLEGVVAPERVLVVTGAAMASPIAGALGILPENVLVEPFARSTAAALAWASHEAARRDPAAVLLSLHADWYVPDREAFVRVARRALDVAEADDWLVTVGVAPRRPETGYGYIVPGQPIGAGAARQVVRFTEKPNVEQAKALIAAGALWNSGLFAWQAHTALAELARHTPEVAAALRFLDDSEPGSFFEAVREVAIDVGLLERSDRVAVVPGDFEWDDIGTWETLARIRPTDGDGNVTVGPVSAVDSTENIVWGEEVPVVLAGVHGLVVVHANGRILVLDRRRAADVKAMLEHLPEQIRNL